MSTASGRAAIPRQTVADFRHSEPRNEDFWETYAAGTHANKYGYKDPSDTGQGRYSYRQTPSGLDTRTLPNGVHKLTVWAADTCGNSGSLSEQIRIAN